MKIYFGIKFENVNFFQDKTVNKLRDFVDGFVYSGIQAPKERTDEGNSSRLLHNDTIVDTVISLHSKVQMDRLGLCKKRLLQ